MKVYAAESLGDFNDARALFREYHSSLDVDLSAQRIDKEIARMPGKYALPKGTLLLARDGDGYLIGCVGVRPFDKPDACELKRLYVRPNGRRSGAGRALMVEAIKFGGAAGYRVMLLDSLPSMEAAIRLYQSFGFKPIPPYWNNPLPGALYFGRTL
jgi:ribosomal protein S18 acetylase RimI-like enzyme